MKTPGELELELCDRDIREAFNPEPNKDGLISDNAYYVGVPMLMQLSRDLKKLTEVAQNLYYELREQKREQDATKN